MSGLVRLLRRRWFLFFAAAGIAAGVAAVFLRSGASRDDRDLVSVAEQGFSVVHERQLTYAFVVENGSTDRALEGARYEARFFDATGALLAERQRPMPVVLPGGKAAIAEESIEVSAVPADMSVLISGGDMRQAADLPLLLPGNLRLGHSPGLEGGKADVTAELWNPYAVDLTDVYVASVYRNADGSIVGGGSKVVPRLKPGAQSETIALENGPGASQVLQDGTRISFPARPVVYQAPMGGLASLVAARDAGKALATPSPPTVRWLPAKLPVYTGPEEAFPFTPVGTPASLVYVVEGDSEPRLIYETGRWLHGPDWLREDVLSFGFSSKKVDPPAEARGPFYTPNLRGTLGLSSGGEQVWEIVGDVTQTFAASPRGQRIAFQASGKELYVVDKTGVALKLDGLGNRVAFVGWSPGADSMLVFSDEPVVSPVPVDGVFYVIPTTDGPAIRLDPPASHHQRETASWSPDGSKIAFVAGVQYDDLDGWRQSGDLYVYDVKARVTRRLTKDRGYDATRPAWSADGKLLTIEDDLIDASSGLLTSLVQLPARSMGAVISPDGRYLVGTEQPYIDGPAGCPRGVLQNRTHVYDRLSSETRTVLDCQDGYYIVRTWDYAWDRAERWLAGGRELIIATTPIYCCHTSTNKLSILNVETGALRTLFERAEGKLDAVASPDGTLILVTGGGLRIFSADGTLLRTIEVPPGYEVQRAVWSPDGSRIAYILVPAGLFEGV